MRKRNVSSPHRINPSLAIRRQMFQQELGAIHLSCIRDCVLITSEKTPPACLSTSHMLTDRFPSLGESLFIAHSPVIHRGEIVPASSMAVGRFIILMVQSRADWWRECVLSDQKLRLEIAQIRKKKRKEKESCFVEREAVKTEWGVDVFLPASIPSITGLLQFPSHSAGVHSAAVASNRQLRHPRVVVILLYFLFFFASIN